MNQTPPDFRQAAAEDQRLVLLQTLTRAPDYCAPEHLLRTALAAAGHHPSADQTRGHLEWLDEQGLVVLVGELTKVARLTLAGEDVATGAARRSGVARVRPT